MLTRHEEAALEARHKAGFESIGWSIAACHRCGAGGKLCLGQQRPLCLACLRRGHDFWCVRCVDCHGDSAALDQNHAPEPDFAEVDAWVTEALAAAESDVDCSEDELGQRMQKLPFEPIRGPLDFTARAWRLGLLPAWFNYQELIGAIAGALLVNRGAEGRA